MRPLVLALPLALLLASPAVAFTSISWTEVLQNVAVRGRAHDPRVPHGYRHREITERALADLGFGPGALGTIELHNFLSDWDQYAHTVAHPPTDRYRPGDHFDRNEHETSAEAFMRGVKTLDDRRLAISRLLEAGRTAEGLAMLGHAIHALQDSCSHSNLVDLSVPEQQEVMALQCGTRVEIPAVLLAKLRITGTSRHALEDLAPEADKEPGFGHDRFAKDNVRFNAEARSPAAGAPGRTKYDRAVELATEATRRFTLQIEKSVSPEAWKKALTFQPSP